MRGWIPLHESRLSNTSVSGNSAVCPKFPKRYAPLLDEALRARGTLLVPDSCFANWSYKHAISVSERLSVPESYRGHANVADHVRGDL